MTGVEYELGKCLPPRLFIVHKQHRNSPNNGSLFNFVLFFKLLTPDLANLLTSYYILDGCIYQSPSLYSVLSHRILSSMSYLQSAMEYADEWLEFDPTKSRYTIKRDYINSSQDNDISMEQENILPDKEKADFITQINSRFMSLLP